MRHFPIFLLCISICVIFPFKSNTQSTMEDLEQSCHCERRSKARLGALEIPETAFLQVDVQDTFREQAKTFNEVVRTACVMMEAGKLLKIPVYVSEHHGYGPTSKDINLDTAAMVVNKTTFSMYTSELRKKLWEDVPRLKTVVLYGVVTHICVEQTAIDLISDGVVVHILAEGVSAATDLEQQLALQRLRSIGCFITTTENVLYKLVKGTTHPAHDEIPSVMLAGTYVKHNMTKT